MTEFSDWSAWYNREPGANDPNLHVAGKARLDPGMTVDFEPGNVGTTPDPRTFALWVTTKPVGDSQGGDEEVSWEGDAGEAVETVRLEGEAHGTIDVRIVT